MPGALNLGDRRHSRLPAAVHRVGGGTLASPLRAWVPSVGVSQVYDQLSQESARAAQSRAAATPSAGHGRRAERDLHRAVRALREPFRGVRASSRQQPRVRAERRTRPGCCEILPART